MKQPSTLPATVTVAEVATFFRTERRHVVNLAKRGLLPAARIAGKYVFLQSDIEKYFRSQIIPKK